MVYSAKLREYQLVAKSTVPYFLTRVIFKMSIFPLWYAPAVPPELGDTTQIWGTRKKNFRRFAPEFKSAGVCTCPQLQNRVGAYAEAVGPKARGP